MNVESTPGLSVAIVIPADASLPLRVAQVRNTDLLRWLQKQVEGYVERVRLPDGGHLIVNEEGIPLGLPRNLRGMAFVAGIRGDVVYLPDGLPDDDDREVTADRPGERQGAQTPG